MLKNQFLNISFKSVTTKKQSLADEQMYSNEISNLISDFSVLQFYSNFKKIFTSVILLLNLYLILSSLK